MMVRVQESSWTWFKILESPLCDPVFHTFVTKLQVAWQDKLKLTALDSEKSDIIKVSIGSNNGATTEWGKYMSKSTLFDLHRISIHFWSLADIRIARLPIIVTDSINAFQLTWIFRGPRWRREEYKSTGGIRVRVRNDWSHKRCQDIGTLDAGEKGGGDWVWWMAVSRRSWGGLSLVVGAIEVCYDDACSVCQCHRDLREIWEMETHGLFLAHTKTVDACETSVGSSMIGWTVSMIEISPSASMFVCAETPNKGVGDHVWYVHVLIDNCIPRRMRYLLK